MADNNTNKSSAVVALLDRHKGRPGLDLPEALDGTAEANPEAERRRRERARKAKAKADEAGIQVDAEHPWEIGNRFLISRYSLDGGPTLRFWRGGLLKWTGTHYAEVAEAEIKAEVWDFLARINQGRVKAQDRDVNGVLAAIKGRVILGADVDVGSWLDDVTAPPWGEGETVIVCRGDGAAE
jgi:hypothetical protein